MGVEDIEIGEDKEELSLSEWELIQNNFDKTEIIELGPTLLEQFKHKIFKKIDNEYFYSAYSDMTIDIMHKPFPYVWSTQNIDQALLHPFNTTRTRGHDFIHPIIYRFNIKEDIYVLISPDKDNINIFNILLKPVIKKIKSYFNSIDNDSNDSNVFKGEKNYRILYILKALNTILQYMGDNVELFNIYGYYNYYDQDEYAFFNFDKISYNTSKTSYYSVTYKAKSYFFPISNKEYEQISFDGSRYTDDDGIKHRMSCNKLIDITYKNFMDSSYTQLPAIMDSGYTTYRCKQRSEYFRNKYLKYKNKYLQLKKK